MFSKIKELVVLLGVGRLQWLSTPQMKFAVTKTSFGIIGGGQKIEQVRGNPHNMLQLYTNLLEALDYYLRLSSCL